ncbi:MAG: M1 family aminopeptidase [Streptosporangiaceae bacterium]
MATYLATVALGDFQIERSLTPDGLPVYVALDPREAAKSEDVVAKIPDMIDYFDSVFGPYPFESAGAIVDHAHFVGYALETQTKPVFDRAPSVGTLAHELAHQWYGDSVSLERWQDIWLNEGFAEYAAWLYGEHVGGSTTRQRFDRLYATPASDSDFWNPPSGDPGGPAKLFSGSVYQRGAMTLQALRDEVGDDAFFQILHAWASQHAYGNANIADFVALAEKASGQDLDHFFDVWLYQPGKPTSW